MKRLFFLISTAALATFGSDHNSAAVERVREAQVVFEEIMAAGDQAIPIELLEKAECVAVIPGVKKAAFIVGGKYGKGVLMCRDGAGWTGPATLRMEGGSVGFQAGGSETDLVLVVMNRRGADRLMKSEFQIGGEAAVAAGPVGRQANAATDVTMRAEMLGYSRARGVFGGLSLEGSTIRQDLEDNGEIHGKRLTTEEIIRGGKGKKTAAGRELAAALTKYSSRAAK
jgi:lipid-binding SYLF domain-containing protein